MLSDGCLYVHGVGSASAGQGSIDVNSAGPPVIYGDTICSAAAQFSNMELDFGAPGSATYYPYVSQFPSLTEKGYPAAGYPQAESVGSSGLLWGLIIQIMSAFTTGSSLATITFDVLTAGSTGAGGSNAAAPTASTIIATRTLTLAQMAGNNVGRAYFIPVPMQALLEFLRFTAIPNTGTASAGTIIAWFGLNSGDTL